MAIGANAAVIAASSPVRSAESRIAAIRSDAADTRVVEPVVANPNVADQVHDGSPRRPAANPLPIQIQKTNCQPPYVIENGKKHWRLECL
jgi:hypothetical protein